MAVELKDFLNEYLTINRLMYMKEYDKDRWFRFQDYVSKDNMTTNQKKWAKQLKTNAAGEYEKGPDGDYIIKDLPELKPGIISDRDFETLFFAAQAAIEGMEASLGSIASDDDKTKIQNFVNSYKRIFGHRGLEQEANATTKSQISLLKASLELIADPAQNLQDDFKRLFKEELQKEGGGEWNIKELIDGIDKEKYNKKADFQKVIRAIARKIKNNISGADTSPEAKDLRNFLEKKTVAGGNVFAEKVKYNIIDDWNSWNAPTITREQKDAFIKSFPDICAELTDGRKKIIFEKFKEHEGTPKPLSSMIDRVNGDVDYSNKESKDYLVPKSEEELTPLEHLKKMVSDSYEKNFKKFEKMRGDQKVLHEETNAFCKALDKIKFQPTDGLDKLIEKGKDVAAQLKTDNKAREAFEWFLKALEEIKEDPKMAGAIKGALQDGVHVNTIAAKLIKIAAEQNKKASTDKAKVALEFLTVMQYTNMTSGLMDKVKADKDLFTFFSNPDMSYNKNGNMVTQSIAKAADTLIRASALGLGYASTHIINRVRKGYGRKFNGKFSRGKKDEFGNAMDAARKKGWVDQNAKEKQRLTDATANMNADLADQQTKQEEAAKLLNNAYVDHAGKFKGAGKESGIIDRQTERLKKAKEKLSGLQAEVEQEDTQIEMYDRLLSMIDRVISLQTSQDNATDPNDRENYSKQKTDAATKFKDYIETISGVPLPGDWDNGLAGLMNTRFCLENGRDLILNNLDYQKKKAAIADLEGKIATKENALNDFDRATNEIKSLQKTIDANNKSLTDWDKNHENPYEELMAHWDFLQGGRSNVFIKSPFRNFIHRNTKANQKNWTDDLAKQYQTFRSGYQFAA